MKRLKKLRTEKGLSQARLAARAGLDPSTVNQIERGARDPSPATLNKLAEALEVGLVVLLEDEAPKADAPHSPEPERVSEEERRVTKAALGAWSEYLGALLERAEELRRDLLALGDLDELDPEDAEHRIDMTFAVALEFALNVGRVMDAHELALLAHVEGTGLTPEERQQLALIFRQSIELIRRRDSIAAFVKTVRDLAEDLAIKKAVKDLLDDAGIPDWDTVQKDG